MGTSGHVQVTPWGRRWRGALVLVCGAAMLAACATSEVATPAPVVLDDPVQAASEPTTEPTRRWAKVDPDRIRVDDYKLLEEERRREENEEERRHEEEFLAWLETVAIDVVPTFECVWPSGDDSYTAYFGYENRSIDAEGRPSYAYIAVGPDNTVTPASYETDLPEEFPYHVEDRPGLMPDGAFNAYPDETLIAEGWDGTTPLIWTLGGVSAQATTETICQIMEGPSTQQRINDAYGHRRLTPYEWGELHAIATFRPEDLPEPYAPRPGDVDSEPFLEAIFHVWDYLSPDEMALVESWFAIVPIDAP